MATTFMESGGSATHGTHGWGATTGTVASDSAVSELGIRSMKFTSGAAGEQAHATSPTGVLADAGTRLSFWVRLNALPTGTLTIARGIQTAAAAAIWQIRVTSAGVLQLWENGVQIGTDGSTLSTGTWYRICLAYTISSTTVNEFRLYLATGDGAGSLTITVSNATLTNVSSNRLRCGWNTATVGNSLYLSIESVYIDNDSSLASLAAIRVTAKLPTTPDASNNNDFTTTIGAPATRVDGVNQRPLSEVDGWSDAGAFEVKENYPIQAAAAGDVNISAKVLVARCGWVWANASAAATGTPKITHDGIDTAITMDVVAALYTNYVDSTIYPTDAKGIGMTNAASLGTTISLYECGVLFAYTPLITLATGKFGSRIGKL